MPTGEHRRARPTVPRFELGNPLGDHLSHFIKWHGTAFADGFDAPINGGQGFGVNFDFRSYRHLEFQVNHSPTLAEFAGRVVSRA